MSHDQNKTYHNLNSAEIASKNDQKSILATSSYIAIRPATATTTTTTTTATSYQVPLTSPTRKQNSDFNFSVPSNLGHKLLGDAIVSCGVTFAVSPFMAVIDKAIMQRAAGTHSITRSCAESFTNMARNPSAFIKSPTFLLMWGVYAATYTTANSLKTIFEHQEHYGHKKLTDRDRTMNKLSMFGGTTLVNFTTAMLKDRTYAAMFGSAGAATKMPIITYGLWGLRDCMVIGSSFVLPDIMSTAIQEKTDFSKKEALQISQLACPILTQFAAGPIHLLALDFYNRPMTNLSFSQATFDRMTLLGKNLVSVFGARIARIAPAYGIGGIGNNYFRDEWRNMLIRREIKDIFLQTSNRGQHQQQQQQQQQQRRQPAKESSMNSYVKKLKQHETITNVHSYSE